MKTKTVFLTGGTGFIGSHIAAELMRQGCFINFLARSNGQFHAEDRILRALSRLTVLNKDQYRVWEGDLNSALAFNITKPIEKIVHCAASLSFKEEDRLETFLTNVVGTKHLLEFATLNNIKRFDLIGTSYVRGNRRGLIKENELNCGQKFFNPYEESKMVEEESVSKWAADTNSKLSVFRPSVVVGNSKTGFASSFSGYYTCARGFVLLKKTIESELGKGNGKVYSEAGISMKSGVLNLPICFPGLPDTPIDILPIDIVVKAILDIAQKCDYEDTGGIFHITNSNLISCKEFIDISLDILGIKGVQIKLSADKNVPQILQRLNEQIDKTAQYYKPYTSYGAGAAVCNQTNTIAALGKPVGYNITKKFLKTVLDYALRVHFRDK